MSVNQLTEIVEDHGSSFLNGLDLADDFDCAKVETFLSRARISNFNAVSLFSRMVSDWCFLLQAFSSRQLSRDYSTALDL